MEKIGRFCFMQVKEYLDQMASLGIDRGRLAGRFDADTETQTASTVPRRKAMVPRYRPTRKEMRLRTGWEIKTNSH